MPSQKIAVFISGGKQHKVKVGDKIKVEMLPGKSGDVLKFNEVLLSAEGSTVEVGAPFVKGAAVEAEISAQAREDKKIVFRYHSKTRYRKFKTHRQPFTELIIKEIK